MKLTDVNQKVEIVDVPKANISEVVTICPPFSIGGVEYTCIVFLTPVLVGNEPSGPVYRQELRGPVIIPVSKLKEPSSIVVPGDEVNV